MRKVLHQYQGPTDEPFSSPIDTDPFESCAFFVGDDHRLKVCDLWSGQFLRDFALPNSRPVALQAVPGLKTTAARQSALWVSQEIGITQIC